MGTPHISDGTQGCPTATHRTVATAATRCNTLHNAALALAYTTATHHTIASRCNMLQHNATR